MPSGTSTGHELSSVPERGLVQREVSKGVELLLLNACLSVGMMWNSLDCQLL